MAQSCGPDVILTKSEDEFQELDHVPLATRLKLLLSSNQGHPKSGIAVGKTKTTKPAPPPTLMPNIAIVAKKEHACCDEQGLFAFSSAFSVRSGTDQQLAQEQSQDSKVPWEVTSEVKDSKIPIDSAAVGSCSQNAAYGQDIGVPGDCDNLGRLVNISICSQQIAGCEAKDDADRLEKVVGSVHTSSQHKVLSDVMCKVKVECLDDNLLSSSGDCRNESACTDVRAAKVRNNISTDFSDDLDHIVLKERQRMRIKRKSLMVANPVMEGNSVGLSDFKPVKSELESPYEGDWVDHMRLCDQMKLRAAVEDSVWSTSGNSECLRKIVPSALEYSPIMSESAKPIKVNRPPKRKKTSTVSVVTALAEDAPELLKVLVEQGISVNEIKLYGETDNDDALDDSFIEGSFSGLEAVMPKLFFRRKSSFKFAPIRGTKGSKPSYCLACLFSLVEQTRYLQFRKWPVEWGWCRDLQSFIFVFERHKRIVLECPEYGYATYFFEFVDSSPIDWQIKRLVTAMKLTSCGRVTLIENKALMVGEDLTEGEAQVLKEYGWIPNTGLGTMLNYHDRVMHDRKNEKDASEWRSKIVKMLMDGYNGGTIVSTTKADKVIDCKDTQNPPTKLEL